MVGAVFAPLGLPIEPALVIFASGSLVIGPLLAAFETQSAVAAASLIAREAPAAAPARAPRRRLMSIRAAILTLLAALIVLTGGVSIGVMYSGQRRNIAYLAEAMIGELSARSTQRTLSYLSPAERAAESLRYLLERELPGIRDREALLAAMRNQLVGNPEFAAVYFGDTAGAFTMVKRMPDGSLSDRLIERKTGSVTVDWRHANPDWAASFPDAVESLEKGYDPRSRGWYRGAAAAGGRIWTDVYLFASDNMLGISEAVPIYGPGEAGAAPLLGVLAVDIGLAELSYFLGGLDISDTGKAYILNEKDQLVALSMPRGSDLSSLFAGKPTGAAASTANLVPADEAGEPLVRQSFLSYLRGQRGSSSFTFRVGRERYISAVTPFPAGAAFRWRIGIVVPESEIYGFVNETSRIVLAAALLIIVASIGIGVRFSRAVTSPLHRLSLEMERIRNFDLSGRERIGSRIAEIHNMAESFSNMKHGLSAFSKYVPAKLVAELIRLGEEPRIGGQRRSLTILFSDVADFTTVSERIAPERLVEEMAVYLGALGNAIMRNRGTVDKYIGDAIMALWNAPGEVRDHEVQACLAALECQELLADLRRERRRRPHRFGRGRRVRIGHHEPDADGDPHRRGDRREHGLRGTAQLHGGRRQRQPGQPPGGAEQVLRHDRAGERGDLRPGEGRGGRPPGRQGRGQGTDRRHPDLRAGGPPGAVDARDGAVHRDGVVRSAALPRGGLRRGHRRPAGGARPAGGRLRVADHPSALRGVPASASSRGLERGVCPCQQVTSASPSALSAGSDPTRGST